MKVEFKKELKKFLISFLYPPNGICPVCKRVLFGRDEYLCFNCKNKLTHTKDDMCVICGKEYAGNNGICDSCGKDIFPFKFAFSLVEYDAVSGDVVVEFKYHNNQDIARSCGEDICEAFMQKKFNFDFVTCVPSKKTSVERRGYNQAAVIASAFAQKANLPVYCELLTVIGEPEDQIGLNFEQRKENVKNCFAVADCQLCYGKNVLIIDDVVTTGATLSECAKAIIESGAESVSFATYATAVR